MRRPPDRSPFAAAIAISLLILPLRISAETVVSGTVSGTWTKAGSPYRATGSIWIDASKTLTIEPGVDVLFDNADAQFSVYGRITAIGTESDSIRFLPGTAPRWGGFYFWSSLGYWNDLVYVRITGGTSDTGSPRTGGIEFAIGSFKLYLGHCVFTRNSATIGGALFIPDRTSVTIEHTVFRDNTAYEKGGAIAIYGASSGADVTMNGCTIVSNVARNGDGGGVWAQNARLTMTRCIVARNACPRTPDEGGGVWIGENTRCVIDGCTITRNVAPWGKSGVVIQRRELATVKNTIIWGNLGRSGSDYVAFGQSLPSSATYSDIGTGYGFSRDANFNIDPLFVDAAHDDYRLSAGSPCIDTGDPASPLDPDGSRADIGALPSSFGGHIPVSGDTVTTTTWTKSGSPYRVDRSVIIPSGNTLAIEPGVDVLCDGNAQFIVQGRIRAIGTRADSIRFLGNASGSWGGIRIVGRDSSVMAYVRISGALADTTTPYRFGGGLYLSGAGVRLSLLDAVISANRADSAGGIYAGFGVFLAATRTTMRDNVAAFAGGVFVSQGRGVFDSCGFEGNTATRIGGGGVAGTAADITLTRCAIRDNTTAGRGGGLHAVGTTVRATRCTITGNDALRSGGGISLTARSTGSFQNCTISGNIGRGDSYGGHPTGGIVSWESILDIRNTIVWGNPSRDLEGTDAGGSLSLTYSNTGANWPGTGDFSANPLFADPGNGDFRLLAGSPCIDTGDPQSPPDPDGTRADIGAYHYPGGNPVAVAVSSDTPRFMLGESVPNPFNPSTMIRFSLPAAGEVRLAIYDVTGRLVRVLVDGYVAAGTHQAVWDGADRSDRPCGSGVYFVRMATPGYVRTRRMTLAR